jgi:hypothetical protein
MALLTVNDDEAEGPVGGSPGGRLYSSGVIIQMAPSRASVLGGPSRLEGPLTPTGGYRYQEEHDSVTNANFSEHQTRVSLGPRQHR